MFKIEHITLLSFLDENIEHITLLSFLDENI